MIELVTDRTQADVDRVNELAKKGWPGMTAEEQAEWSAGLKGAYNYADLNRVESAVGEIARKLGLFPITKSKSGSTVRIYAGSGYLPAKIKLTSDTITDFSSVLVKVSRDGKNLATAQQTFKGATRYAESVFEGKNCIRYNSGGTVKNKLIDFKENQQYTISFKYQTRIRLDANSSSECLIAAFYTDGTYTQKLANYEDSTEWEDCVFTTTAGKTVESIGVLVYNYCTDIYIDVDTFQLEAGTSATPYEPYIEPQTATANADGTVDSAGLYGPECLTLFTDTPNVIINYEYAVEWDFTNWNGESPDANGEILVKVDWDKWDIPDQNDMNRYLGNIKLLRNAGVPIVTTPTAPNDMSKLTYTVANNIEKILADINTTSATLFHSGEIYCGEA